MKVIINTCFGGFGVSHEANLLYAQKKGITLYYEGEGGLFTDYYLVPVEEYKKVDVIPWQKRTQVQQDFLNQNYFYLEGQEGIRTDPTLIEVVEELGEKANGSCDKLKIVEVPEGVDWYISEYDGNEHIAQHHQTWS